jgi:hypothetical protein
MNIHAALEEVTRWCAKQTAAGDPEQIEVDCHATVCITIGENAPPWHVRLERRCSSGAGSPVAQLRYDLEKERWALHHGDPPPAGWCSEEDAVHAGAIGQLLEMIEADRCGLYEGLPPGFRWPWTDGPQP